MYRVCVDEDWVCMLMYAMMCVCVTHIPRDHRLPPSRMANGTSNVCHTHTHDRIRHDAHLIFIQTNEWRYTSKIDGGMSNVCHTHTHDSIRHDAHLIFIQTNKWICTSKIDVTRRVANGCHVYMYVSWENLYVNTTVTKDDSCDSTLTHCNTRRHTATHCNTLHANCMHTVCTLYACCMHIATHCNTLQHSATHCNTLHHTAPHCKIRISPSRYLWNVTNLLWL